MTELVISGLLVRIGEDLVSFVDLLELFFGRFIAGIQVRVVLFGELSVCLFDLVL